jgi:hypothetical protein
VRLNFSGPIETCQTLYRCRCLPGESRRLIASPGAIRRCRRYAFVIFARLRQTATAAQHQRIKRVARSFRKTARRETS